MQTPLNASASTAGALLSSTTFEVPQFQREYSWQEDEVAEFWRDLQSNLGADTYFLGLIILTERNEDVKSSELKRKLVVDGQQRLITLSLLATAIHHEALRRGRQALADRIQADFLRSIDYDSDDTDPRVRLSDKADNETFQHILETGEVPIGVAKEGSVSERIVQSYTYLKERLSEDLKADPFKRLGKWTEFLTHKVYFAVFVHPDASSAYQVFEVINTRGKELTTADLLKSHVLSQTRPSAREERYHQWQEMAGQFAADGANTFVQYIRHAVTVRNGHVLPKDLFGFLAQRVRFAGKHPPTSEELIELLQHHLPLYLQMIDPSAAGPAEPDALRIFGALNTLGVIAVRPILLAIAGLPDSLSGMKFVLRLVVRRIVVGNLGTGNVERRFGEAAKKVSDSGTWKPLVDDFRDLNPPPADFIEQLRKRSLNKGVLSFLRRSIIEKSTTPEVGGSLHFIWARQASDWSGMSEEDGAYWGSTIGNTFLAKIDRRPKAASSWMGFKKHLLPQGVEGEWSARLEKFDEWNAKAVEEVGGDLAGAAAKIWYGEV